MELHRGCIIYVKLLFLPGNPGICPLLTGPKEEIASGRLKTGPDQSSFSDAYLFLPSMQFLSIFFSVLVLCVKLRELKFTRKKSMSVHEKYILGIIREL